MKRLLWILVACGLIGGAGVVRADPPDDGGTGTGDGGGDGNSGCPPDGCTLPF